MAQIKIFGLKEHLVPHRQQLSEIIHQCVMTALEFPADKRVHRFFPLEKENFFYPAGRSEAYTIIEITMIEGRSVAARKQLIRLLFDKLEREMGLAPMDVEVCIMEAPACNWGFRGLHGDEAKLNYKVNV
jgi:phenylpyruvate tautomerase PptA (4-oxalocrotonate tautomerase family)